ncbi:hypothetical protein THAOC_31026 [Thalassiosira oceanica]|uniref:Uncharacterized protein n=1 Tax=Thalassiosira oceanica TaxID=159749 RepID=K0R902_THAOC|nr:hypothetical protein THAOC_31026 [Thalassiosira oceanica]|mmetsp:Transcript_35182/g.84033  ORF Transcript_35182/g.84033 Transcript_35182/m.84033 type:complete len:464 (+) Transcript_35182:183-1574(+)|eukprot:EJK50043.1 hypothetical protein THAOC_31026 [Thalassiosira oceanica]
MFNRIRASLTGDQPPPQDAPHGSRSPAPSPSYMNGSQTSPTPSQRPGFMPPFLKGSSQGSEESPEKLGSGFLGMFTSPAQQQQNQNNVEASPRTIRESASALLKLATPPLVSGRGSDANSYGYNDGMDEDMAQRESLETRISRRDQYASKLQNDLHRMQSTLSQFQKDNQTLRRQQLESTHRHSIAVKLWKRTNDGLRARVECFENETTPAAAREIANLIRDAAPPNKDSAYLMMLQDQLTKATAKLDHLGSQTEIVLHKGEEVVESLREEMNEVIRERCRMELELIDQERMLEDDMKRMVFKTERRLKRVQGEIDFLEKKAVETLKSQETDDDTEDGSNADENPNEAMDGKKGGGGEESVDSDGGDSDSNDNGPSEAANGDSNAAGKPSDPEDQTPEHLREELRRIAIDRDKCLSVLQKKLREKNEEYHQLMRLKEGRQEELHKVEQDRLDRENWKNSQDTF